MAILGFTTTILVTWEGVLLVFDIGLVKYVSWF
jgi:choline transport protein